MNKEELWFKNRGRFVSKAKNSAIDIYDIDDLLQECAYIWFKNFDDYYKSEEQYCGFVQICFRNRIVNIFNSVKKKQQVEINILEKIDSKSIAHSENKSVIHVLDNFSEREQKIIRLKANQYTNNEIAKELSEHPNKITYAIQKIRQRKIAIQN